MQNDPASKLVTILVSLIMMFLIGSAFMGHSALPVVRASEPVIIIATPRLRMEPTAQPTVAPTQATEPAPAPVAVPTPVVIVQYVEVPAALPATVELPPVEQPGETTYQLEPVPSGLDGVPEKGGRPNGRKSNRQAVPNDVPEAVTP